MINFNVYYDNNSQKKINKTENFLISSDLKSKIKIINDIPRFCESEYTKNFGDQWSNYPEDQFDESNDETYKNLNIARDTLQEVFPIKLDKIENANILEAGSGNGRFTYIMLKNGAKVDTFDKSHAVDVLKNNLKKKNYLKNLKNEETELISKIKKLETKNSLLTDNLDLDYIEFLIRDKFLLGKKSETVYIIRNNEN